MAPWELTDVVFEADVPGRVTCAMVRADASSGRLAGHEEGGVITMSDAASGPHIGRSSDGGPRARHVPDRDRSWQPQTYFNNARPFGK